MENPVEEGDDFRLVVRKKYKDHTAPYKKIRVFWYSETQTADETDYEHMYAEGQASNGHQSKTGKMGRDFHTLEDIIPEPDETYLVKFNNSNDDGDNGECAITIKDDDGVGIYGLEIRSIPREIPVSDVGDETMVAYTQGDVILITAHFTHPVTTVKPDTGEQADYAGLYLQIGENRRVAHVLRGDGTDTLIYGYTVQADDEDLNGISVENGWAGTGMYYNEETSDSGLWPVNSDDGRLNRVFYGLSDDPGHLVAQVDVGEPIITPPVEDPLIDEPSIVEPVPGPWSENAVPLESDLWSYVEGELTSDDGGRDWYALEATGGRDYIIEVKNQMVFEDQDNSWTGFSIQFVPDALVDPSILEIVDDQGTQVLDEHDDGGFTANFARAFFTPERDGTYYIAVGAGSNYPGGLGFYSFSVRADDHADDYKASPDVVIRPGESITARIDSDVSSDDPGLNPWEWSVYEDEGVPVHGLESMDDRDAFRFEIAEEGIYRVSVSDAPTSVGIWATWEEDGHIRIEQDNIPVESLEDHYEPGTYLN